MLLQTGTVCKVTQRSLLRAHDPSPIFCRDGAIDVRTRPAVCLTEEPTCKDRRRRSRKPVPEGPLAIRRAKMRDRFTCPSAQPDQPEAAVIGVVASREGGPRVTLLPASAPLDAIVHLIPPDIPIPEVVRLAAPCAEQRCGHFHDQRCTLAARIVDRLPPVTVRLSPCAIRPSCRWWGEHGPAACHRCGQIVTEPFRAEPLLREVAAPPSGRANLASSQGA